MKKRHIFLFTVSFVMLCMYTLIILFTKEFNPLMWSETLIFSFLASILASISISVIEILQMEHSKKIRE